MSEATLSADQLPRRRRRRPEVVIEPSPPVARPDDAPPAVEADPVEPVAEPEPGAEAESDTAPDAEPDTAPDAESDTADAPAEAVDEPAAPADEAASTELIDRRCLESWPVEPDVTSPVVTPERPAPPRRSRGRTLAAAGAVLVVGGAVSAAILAGPMGVDESFVAAARDAGHVVAPGAQQQLVVSAARKICQRREFHSTVAERRASALSPDELRAVGQTFRGDPRGFTLLALDTYCGD